MNEKLELISFHVGLFFAALIISFIAFMDFFSAGVKAEFLVACMLLCSVLSVCAISWAFRAYILSSWVVAAPHTASVLILIGHLAPLSAVYFYLLMVQAGTGSGIIFIPIFAWAAFFYSIGIIWCMIRLLTRNS
jgi:hypothetical protein